MTLLSKFVPATMPIFWVLTAFLAIVFLTGGGSRPDVQSLIILRPLSVVVCGIALFSLHSAHVRAYRTLFVLAAAACALVLAHLIPLPPEIWQLLPGRELMITVDRAADIGAHWRPIALVPALAWNAFYSLFVPLAVLLLAVQLRSEERYNLLKVVLGLGLFSGVWGLFQVLGSSDGPLYLYRYTTNGAAVGLFANRNHQAVLLSALFPMLAVFASMGVRTVLNKWLALGFAAFLIPLILVTGSRAGIFTALVALPLAFFLYRKPAPAAPLKRTSKQPFNPAPLLIGLGVLSLAVVTVVLSRAEAFRRLLTLDQNDELRWQIWGPIADMAMKYFPLGSGIGSFVQVYQIDEPDRLLGLTYVNRAHNDWLEIWLTAGVPGAILLAVLVGGFLMASYAAFARPANSSRSIIYARVGAAILFIFGLASVVDYPLRTPSLACVAVLAIIWLCGEPGKHVEKAGGV